MVIMDTTDYKLDLSKIDPVLLKCHGRDRRSGRYQPVYGPGRYPRSHIQRRNTSRNYHANIYGRRKSSIQVVLVSRACFMCGMACVH